jgi:cellulose synthase/poly-beta-1,6-N-acetylglucosamine synthase-like glycosyltransferase
VRKTKQIYGLEAFVKAQDLRPEYEIVLVPDMMPRTKPKALNYGLAGARGEYLAIYDAEDRPQLQKPADLLVDRGVKLERFRRLGGVERERR